MNGGESHRPTRSASSDLLERILPAGMLFTILGSLALGPRVPGVSLGCNLCFWALFLLFLGRRGIFGREFPRFLFLLPLFYLLFFFHREAPERMDYLFGSDTARYLKDVLSFTTGPRHMGISILTSRSGTWGASGRRSARPASVMSISICNPP